MAKAQHPHIILLLADGFEENALVVVTILREAGLRVTMVGLRSSQVTGLHGIVVKPDMSLDRLLETAVTVTTLIVPEGNGHIERLRRDPRVSTLLQKRLPYDGLVAGMGARSEKFLRSYTREPIRCVALDKGETCTDRFAHQIVAQLLELRRG
ncbi:MAG: DJ-1/PfpI family protein [Anaerolineae bacterium]|nr:DJ-1/PfpI family protein [Anaerolineae bacterium]